MEPVLILHSMVGHAVVASVLRVQKELLADRSKLFGIFAFQPLTHECSTKKIFLQFAKKFGQFWLIYFRRGLFRITPEAYTNHLLRGFRN